MKWITHSTVAVGLAMTLGLPTSGLGGVALSGVALGSVLPDMIDHGISRLTPNPQKTFNAIHRGATHWFGWYVAMLIFLGLCANYPRSMGAYYMNFKLLYFVGGLGFGGLMHVLLDMCTPSGVPIFPFTKQKRVSLKLFSTGSVQEYLFLALTLGLFAALGDGDFSEVIRKVQRFF